MLYEVYIGKDKYNIYIGDEQFNFGTKLESNVYGAISASYNPTAKQLEATVTDLGPRGSYAASQGRLGIGLEVMCGHHPYWMNRPQHHRRPVRALTRGEPGKYWTAGYEYRESNSQAYVQEITHIGDKLVINISQLLSTASISCYGSAVNSGVHRPWHFDDAYVDYRFYLMCNKGHLRYVKTLTNPIRIYKTQV